MANGSEAAAQGPPAKKAKTEVGNMSSLLPSVAAVGCRPCHSPLHSLAPAACLAIIACRKTQEGCPRPNGQGPVHDNSSDCRVEARRSGYPWMTRTSWSSSTGQLAAAACSLSGEACILPVQLCPNHSASKEVPLGVPRQL